MDRLSYHCETLNSKIKFIDMGRRISCFVCICMLIATSVNAQSLLKYGAQREGKRTDAAMQKWRDNRFGQFVTFGLFSVPGGHWKGKYYGGAAEWIKSTAQISNEEYDRIRADFNPVGFNATEWAQHARQMGAKYALITTKFHDGFCLWPSQYTDFDIENTPYHKDLLKEFVDAYNKEGIDVIFYYSVLDWHHEDWRYDIKNESDSVAFKRYWDWMTNQIVELMTNYPTVKGFWYDGTWDKSVVKRGEYTYALEQKMKSINPGIISGSRLRADETGARHFDANKKMMGDYEQGWERKLPNKVMENDWECVMTIPENQWGYHSDWRGHVKTPAEVLEMIIGSASWGGNFMINFGPKGDGTIRKEEKEMALAVGKWMSVNGEAIYGCESAGLPEQKWGYYTMNPKTGVVYMVVLNHPVSDALRVKLPARTVLTSASSVTSPKMPVRIEEIARNEYFIHCKKTKRDSPYVIKIELKQGEGDAIKNYVAPKI